jgi:hypothetical protein
MSPSKGWFESDDEYEKRVAHEANEHIIENSTGDAPSKGWFESDDAFRERVEQEANERVVEDSTGDAPSKGWFESDDKYRDRIHKEANERVVKDSTGEAPSKGWFESDGAYDTRVRKTANERIIEDASGEAPSKGWFESDHAYRSRIAHAAREIRAGDRGDRSIEDDSSYDGGGESGGGGGGGVMGSFVSKIVGGLIILWLLSFVVPWITNKIPSHPGPITYKPMTDTPVNEMLLGDQNQRTQPSGSQAHFPTPQSSANTNGGDVSAPRPRVIATPTPGSQGNRLPGERFPETRTRLLTDTDLNRLSLEAIQDAINEMYARHGADFKSDEIRRRFSGVGWYQPVRGRTHDQAEMLFTSLEAENIKLLGHWRDSRRSGINPVAKPAAVPNYNIDPPPIPVVTTTLKPYQIQAQPKQWSSLINVPKGHSVTLTTGLARMSVLMNEKEERVLFRSPILTAGKPDSQTLEIGIHPFAGFDKTPRTHKFAYGIRTVRVKSLGTSKGDVTVNFVRE